MSGAGYGVELEPEVEAWLDSLSRIDYFTVERHADRLAEEPLTLGEPYSRHLGGPLRELRFRLGPSQVRVTYWIASGRRVVLLTVFRKSRSHEASEVTRAMAAQRVCAAEHGPATHIYERIFKEES